MLGGTRARPWGAGAGPKGGAKGRGPGGGARAGQGAGPRVSSPPFPLRGQRRPQGGAASELRSHWLPGSGGARADAPGAAIGCGRGGGGAGPALGE